jgi:hypothetical protein
MIFALPPLVWPEELFPDERVSKSNCGAWFHQQKKAIKYFDNK